MKTIINWIDATKAISIMAVFFVHSQLYYGCWLDKVNDFIHPFYVNSFFFVSGYLLFRKQLSSPIIEEGVLQYVIGGVRIWLTIYCFVSLFHQYCFL